jgi:hypothetical protein
MAGQRKTKSRSSRRVAGRVPSTEPLAVTAAKPPKVSVGTNANRKRARHDESDEQPRQQHKQQRTEPTADARQPSPAPELHKETSHDFQLYAIAPFRAHSQEVAGKATKLSLPSQDARSHDASGELPGLHPKAKRAAVSAGDGPSGKRSLRSRDSRLRLKSKLAHYFPYYEDFMNDEPIETGMLDRLVFTTSKVSY